MAVGALLLLAPHVPAAATEGSAAGTGKAFDETRFLPDPSGDPYLDQRFTTTNAMANGTILASRPVTIGAPLALTSHFSAWQIWFKSTDADGAPIAALTTVLKPAGWNGRIVSNNFAIDGLGAACNPSYQLTHTFSIEAPDVTRQLLDRGYAVVMTDYQGPRMAYGHGPTEGREVLDGIRAALRSPDAGLSGPVALLGYSGGGIATVWAAQLHPTYAPELDLVGAAAGGAPTDLGLLPATMDGKPPASAFYLMGAFGVARATPEALRLLSPVGAELAARFKNSCVHAGLLFGPAPIPIGALTDGSPYDTDIAKAILRDTRAGQQAPRIPIYFWHGIDDEFIPLSGVRNLAQEWRARGVDVTLDELSCGGHVTCAFVPNGIQAVDRWLAPAPAG
ncbi:lipase family protein [Nocardia sp. NPDC052566]|uniref:lipase family protein n=1 Tax=Nocardia sp. NPDC052566 TaxID=3364330 RepID=UPI0037CC82D0